jgi:hypothetical protein
MSKIIDSFWVALGFKTDTAGLDAFTKKAQGARDAAISWGAAISAAVVGIGVEKIAKIGSDFEQNRIQIAGFLSALGVSSDFNAGLTQADETIKSITNAAARLPGEAEEYIDVFKAGLPFVQGALPGASLGQMTDFTNKLTAIGKAMRLPADLIGREISEILAPGEGNAQKRLPLFRLFLPLMRQLQGQANLTAQGFNAMTQPQRAKLMMQVFEKLQPMLDASAQSFDALWGAVKSTFTILTRLATEGLFAQIKVGLDELNNALFTADGQLTPFAKDIVDTAKKFIGYVTQMIGSAVRFAVQLGKNQAVLAALKLVLAAVGLALTGLAFQKAASGVLALISTLKNLKLLLTGGVFAAIALIAEDIWGYFNGYDSVLGLLIEKIPKLKDAWQIVTTGMTDLWNGFLDSLKLPDWLVNLDRYLGDLINLGGHGIPGLNYTAPKRDTGGPVPYLPSWGMGAKERDERRAARHAADADNPLAPASAAGAGFKPFGRYIGEGSTVNSTNNIAKIEINSNDPKAVGREIQDRLDDQHRRATRNAQSVKAL